MENRVSSAGAGSMPAPALPRPMRSQGRPDGAVPKRASRCRAPVEISNGKGPPDCPDSPIHLENEGRGRSPSRTLFDELRPSGQAASECDRERHYRPRDDYVPFETVDRRLHALQSGV